ncbi:MAG TPA: DinB family protein [Candidatus Kapabacteria bacterium]|nr:DinB family protein [Candidatus Kapabacteria bacterium]
MNTEQLLSRFDTAISTMISMLSSLNEEELNQPEATGKWSAGQVGQHIRMSTNGFPQLLRSPGVKVDRAADEKVPQIEDIFLNYQTKFSAPDFIVPEDRRYTSKELIDALESMRNESIVAAKEIDLSDGTIGFELPGLGQFTKYEWIAFAAIHTTRHNEQLKRIINKVKQQVA